MELVLSGALLALGALIKSTALIVSLFALIVYPALWWYAARRKATPHFSLIPLLSFFVSFCAAWSLLSQSLAHLPAYFRGTWALASGYTPAMSNNGPGIQVVWAVLILSLFAGVIAGFHIGGRKARVGQCLMLGGLAFWAWKEGFTDQDRGWFLHPMTFYGTALLIASAGTALVSEEKSRYLTTCVYGAYAIALLCLLQAYPMRRPVPTFGSVVANYEEYVGLISSKSRRVAQQRSETLAIQAHYQLPEGALKAIGSASVNMFPWSLMMTQGYDLHLVPSPVLQSYSAYTPYLDGLNAHQVWAGESADKIIYTYADLDRRYPLFDEPATFRAILTCYQTRYSATRYTVLEHVGCEPPHLLPTDRPEEGTFGKWIPVPPQATYAGIGVHTTILGHLENLLFKAHYVRVFFRLADGSVKGPYRFIYRVAEDGLFVRYFVSSQSEAGLLFSGNVSGLQRITDIKLVIHPGAWGYAKHFEVRFFDVTPANRRD